LLPRNGEIPTDPRQALLGCLDLGQTGCLLSRADSGIVYRVYVMLGQILAAESDEDDARLLALLLAAEHVDPVRHAQLAADAAAAGGLAAMLFDTLAEELVLELLFERFREDLYRFLGAEGRVEFLAMDAVFVDNIQVGHDSRALVDELTALSTRIGALESRHDLLIGPGAVLASQEVERIIVARCRAPRRLGELLLDSPWEASRLIETVQGMLEGGMLVSVQPVADEEILSDEDTADAPLPGSTPIRAFASEEDDLAAFQDYDTVREAGAFLTDRTLLDRVDLDGSGAPGLVASTETLIEMEEADGKESLKSAVSLNFSGPKLAEEEVLRKLEVTNEVLATIVAALESGVGRGAGVSRLQLLLEGTSVNLAPLFKGVEVGADGTLPVNLIVKNLRKRPLGEHRRLLNRGLADLIERALSAADEELDVDGFETMLEQLAGYQQRLGV
jgi:hypothetical protein